MTNAKKRGRRRSYVWRMQQFWQNWWGFSHSEKSQTARKASCAATCAFTPLMAAFGKSWCHGVVTVAKQGLIGPRGKKTQGLQGFSFFFASDLCKCKKNFEFRNGIGKMSSIRKKQMAKRRKMPLRLTDWDARWHWYCSMQWTAAHQRRLQAEYQR